MILENAITHIYPNLNPHKDFRIGWDEEKGGYFVLYWDENNPPYPSETQLQEAWLELIKDDKLTELKIECNIAILGRFIAEVDGVAYQFSCDTEAQMNFEKVDRAFDKGRMTEIPWTAYNMDGEVVRVILNVNNFEPVYLGHLFHIQSNIAKLRDELQPRLDSAVTEGEIEGVVWEWGNG